MLNKVILIGRLTKDPELRVTNTGIPVCTFSLAVNRNYQGANGEREADFFNCVSYRKTAENVGKFMKKGNLMSVEGRIQNRSYEGQDGVKRYITEIVCENVVFLESSRQQNDNQSYGQAQQSYQQQQQPSFNINNQQQNRYNNPMNNYQGNNNYSQPQDNFFEDNSNIDISEDDLPF